MSDTPSTTPSSTGLATQTVQVPVFNTVTVEYLEPEDSTGSTRRVVSHERFVVGSSERLDIFMADQGRGATSLDVTVQRIGHSAGEGAGGSGDKILLDVRVWSAVMTTFRLGEVVWDGFVYDGAGAGPTARAVRLRFTHRRPVQQPGGES